MPLIAHAISPGIAAFLSGGGVEDFLAKSFWRVLIFNGGSGTTGASEVRFKKGGDKKNGTPLGSGGDHGNAFDDNESTNWTITGEFGEYIGLEFTNVTEIDEVDIVSMFNDSGNTLIDYEVQFSEDGIEWITMWTSFGNIKPTGNNQTKTSIRPFVLFDGAAVIHERLYAIMGTSNGAMVNQKTVYAILGKSNDAMVNHETVYAIFGKSNDAMVNVIKVYAIYDSGS